MPNANPFSSLGISSRQFLTIFVLLFNSFIWFFMNLFILSSALKSTSSNDLLAWAVYLMAIIGSSLLAALVSPRRNRLGLIYVWLLLGIVSSFFLSALAINIGFEYLLIIMLFSGVAFGLGMPSALAYFAEYTAFENRGRMGGVILLLTFLIIPFVSMLPGSLAIDSYIATIWRTVGLVMFFLVRPLEKIEEPRKPVRFSSVLSDRAFLLFLIPWFMAWLIDRFEYQIFLEKYTELSVLSLSVEPIVGTVFVIIGGFLADWIGRKKVVVSGFVALGLGYAVLGVATQTTLSQYVYIAIDGIAWGIFFVLFLLVLWGDLSSNTGGGHEKYYAVGSMPFFIAYLMQYVALPYIKSIPIQAPEVSFSFASLFLFVAILPLIYAPETLPQKKIRERQIKKYVEEAQKIAERESLKIEV